MENRKLETIIIVGKFSDNKVRQLLLKENTKESILYLIQYMENSIRILDEEIDGLSIENRPEQ
jgi:hypothetical protein